MKKGILIAFEGTDCSGKETQVNMLMNRLMKNGIRVAKCNYPRYDTATGKIVGGCYLGKQNIGAGYFEEGATKVDPYVASLYFAADRKYNQKHFDDLLELNNVLITDRYVDSNLGHQMSKIESAKEQKKFFNFITKLEFGMLGLKKADLNIFLHMPTVFGQQLAKSRNEAVDEHESDTKYLKKSEATYLKIAKKRNYKIISCVRGRSIKSIEEIGDEIYEYVAKRLKIKKM